MNLAEKVEVLADAGMIGTLRACEESKCAQCEFKDEPRRICQLYRAVINLERAGYDVVID